MIAVATITINVLLHFFRYFPQTLISLLKRNNIFRSFTFYYHPFKFIFLFPHTSLLFHSLSLRSFVIACPYTHTSPLIVVRIISYSFHKNEIFVRGIRQITLYIYLICMHLTSFVEQKLDSKDYLVFSRIYFRTSEMK